MHSRKSLLAENEHGHPWIDLQDVLYMKNASYRTRIAYVAFCIRNVGK